MLPINTIWNIILINATQYKKMLVDLHLLYKQMMLIVKLFLL